MPAPADATALPPGCACDPALSQGRRHPEAPAPTRNDFQRDRDRVIHSTAFRRLVYKTQVFLNHEGDLFRTRLTHSLEVAQLGRSIARSLGLNEDLVEAIALAHDLGHTPFGHAGQDALNACLHGQPPEAEVELPHAPDPVDGVPGHADAAGPDEPRGGFEHNMQSLRVVDELEERYPAFNGLNLCFETREGILKHCSRANAQWLEAREPGGVGARFLRGQSPSLEAQLANLADEIAYNAHDIDDGVRSGLLTLAQLEAVPLFDEHRRAVLREHPDLTGRRVLFESIRRMLSAQVYDVIDATRAAVREAGVDSLDGVRQHGPLLRFSPGMRQASSELKRFLMLNLYRHPQVLATTGRARRIVGDLYQAYTQAPEAMAQPPQTLRPLSLRRRVADHIAGMTDRYAIREHERLTGLRLFT
ncbi:deoxyguanosinetriphosphate triphosphohydrolase family protein [Aquabacterium sp. A08]|uniref:deoxyguanosinetriphosphate triphosphohydrolase family protein n=1 Tax=Aquabacterium sp. A08 TaxID=2718532 RepID=UPI001421BD37|nr:deoxyguanosinetriphosphate triphosphohydrolase family protein [Aquabacterium sp. A08]NIC42467.1 deoxyguanosinetriphosphate triphosphohydrolase family protein [Aquabacterium sp. A08]NIC42506.1 deoxyguanosinetriphosphate triphosphohydrolase family protein [Aquabacterium sp. A08]